MTDKVSASELANITGKSRQWICKLCRDGRIPAERVGNVWMVDPLVPLPLDPRAMLRAKRQARRDEYKQIRRKQAAAMLTVGTAPVRTWRELSKRELEEDYSHEERAVFGAIQAGWYVDAEGRAWVRSKEGEHGAVRVDGGIVRQVGRMGVWNDTLKRLFRTEGGITSVDALMVQDAPSGKSETAVQLEIDGWVDKGAEIDDSGVVTLDGVTVGKVEPWGAFERKWYRMSLDSI